MRPSTPRGLLALPAALTLAGAVVIGAGAGAGRATARVELELAGVLPLPEGQAGLVLLREKGAGRILPLLVPDRTVFEAGARAGDTSLVARALDALGAKLREVELEAAEETAEGALLRVAHGRRELAVPGRPSESVALALAAGVPILIRRRLLEREGLDPGELEAARREVEGGGSIRL
jgi:bifunctional DNase/RNase